MDLLVSMPSSLKKESCTKTIDSINLRLLHLNFKNIPLYRAFFDRKNVNYSVNINEPSSLFYLVINRLPTYLGLFFARTKILCLYCAQCNFRLNFTFFKKRSSDLLNNPSLVSYFFRCCVEFYDSVFLYFLSVEIFLQ